MGPMKHVSERQKGIITFDMAKETQSMPATMSGSVSQQTDQLTILQYIHVDVKDIKLSSAVNQFGFQH